MANFFSSLLGVFAPKSTGTGVAGVSTTAVGAAAYFGLVSKVLVALEGAGVVPAGLSASLAQLLPALGGFLTVVGVRNAVVNSVAKAAAPAAK